MNYQLIGPEVPKVPPVEQVFINRGLQPKDLYHYKTTTEQDLIDPVTIQNIKRGVTLLIKHIQAKDKIFIQVDSDCDGYTSAALLINYLNSLFPAYVQNYITYRLHPDKSHGLKLETIPEDIKMVIAPDASSNDYEIHKALAERGCDVLVIDHHIADHESEYACIINNQISDYPNKTLSGAGMVYKFCSYIDELLNIDNSIYFLDLAALGIIADIMDLREFETRYIIEQGMDNPNNPFIKEMMKRQEFKIQNHLTPFNISFYVAPFVNAMTRSGTLEERTILFESMLEYLAYEQIPSTKRGCKGLTETRVEQAVRTCTNVKNRQTKIITAQTEIIEQIIEKKHLLDNVLIAVKLPVEMAADRNVTGLIATQIANKYRHPTAILNQTDHDGEIWWEGSMRGAPHIPITDTRKMFLDTDLVEYCEGHANAGGVGIKDELFPLLIDHLNNVYKDIDFSPTWFIDLKISMTYPIDLIEEWVYDLGKMNDYWGQGLEKPYILFTKVRINKDNIQIMKGTTIKITCGNLSFIKFNTNEEEFDFLYSETGWKELSIIGTCAINEWNGYENPQVLIEDYEIERTMAFDF